MTLVKTEKQDVSFANKYILHLKSTPAHLKPKHQLDRGSPCEDTVVGMVDKQEIQDAQ